MLACVGSDVKCEPASSPVLQSADNLDVKRARRSLQMLIAVCLDALMVLEKLIVSRERERERERKREREGDANTQASAFTQTTCTHTHSL